MPRYEDLLCGTCQEEVNANDMVECCDEVFHRGGCFIAHRDEMERENFHQR